MKLETKRRIAAAALVVLFLWPLGHYFVVRATHMNPWKWFGWAMYATPPPRVRANAIDLATDRSVPLETLDPDQRARLFAAYEKFSDARMEYGSFITPDNFARAVFRAFPDVEGLKIQVQHVQMDRGTAMIGSEKEVFFEYRRDER